MQHYRAFQIGLDGRVLSRTDLSCDNDQDAERQAIELTTRHDVELWRLDRRVAVFKARPAKPSPVITIDHNIASVRIEADGPLQSRSR